MNRQHNIAIALVYIRADIASRVYRAIQHLAPDTALARLNVRAAVWDVVCGPSDIRTGCNLGLWRNVVCGK